VRFLVLCCALGACTPVARLTLVEPRSSAPSLPLVVLGPAHSEPRGRRCSPEDALAGPVTVAGGWGGAWHGCRTGPSPREVWARRLRNDGRWKRCLVASGVTWLEGRVLVSRAGSVAAVTIDELEPESADVRPCLARLTRYELVKAGCELEQRLHFAQLD